jgi:hypothetical protein
MENKAETLAVEPDKLDVMAGKQEGSMAVIPILKCRMSTAIDGSKKRFSHYFL